MEAAGIPEFFGEGKLEGVLVCRLYSGSGDEPRVIVYQTHNGGKSWRAGSAVSATNWVVEFCNADAGWMWASNGANKDNGAHLSGNFWRTLDGGKSVENGSGWCVERLCG